MRCNSAPEPDLPLFFTSLPVSCSKHLKEETDHNMDMQAHIEFQKHYM